MRLQGPAGGAAQTPAGTRARAAGRRWRRWRRRRRMRRRRGGGRRRRRGSRTVPGGRHAADRDRHGLVCDPAPAWWPVPRPDNRLLLSLSRRSVYDGADCLCQRTERSLRHGNHRM